jgi:hypothetical protein
MNRCIGITKKGDRCKNTINVGNLCHLHSKQIIKPVSPVIVKPSTPIKPVSPVKAKKAIPVPKVKAKKAIQPVKVKKAIQPIVVDDKDLIYDPYYGKNVSHSDNCGPKRKSLERVKSTNLNKDFVSMFCDVLPLKNIVNVVGPVSYAEFRYKNYNIAIFGEYHTIESPPKLPQENTLNFSSFILSIITQNATKEYDFFLETFFRSPGYNYKEIYSGNTILNLLDTDFKGCFDIVKKCPYKNLRAHYSDYRSASDFLTSDLYSIYNYIFFLPKLPLQSESLPYNLQMLIANPLKKYDEIIVYIDNLINTDKKILKQLNSIPVNIKKSILKFYNLFMKTKERNDFQKFIEKSKLDAISTFKEKDVKLLRTFIAYYIMVYGALMDVYTLARMFKIYDPKNPKNIIVYAGDAHMRVYQYFMNDLNDCRCVMQKEGEYYITFSEDDKKKSFLFT